jgi:hypothetical protein
VLVLQLLLLQLLEALHCHGLDICHLLLMLRLQLLHMQLVMQSMLVLVLLCHQLLLQPLAVLHPRLRQRFKELQQQLGLCLGVLQSRGYPN